MSRCLPIFSSFVIPITPIVIRLSPIVFALFIAPTAKFANTPTPYASPCSSGLEGGRVSAPPSAQWSTMKKILCYRKWRKGTKAPPSAL